MDAIYIYLVCIITLSAIGHALQSGAHHALIYDTLQVEGKVNRFEKILSRIRAIDYAGSMISGVIGALIATRFQYVTTYWFSLGSLVIALLISLTMEEVRGSDKKKESHRWTKADWSEIYRFMLKRANIRYITLIGIVSGGTMVFLEEFWQIYVRAINISVPYFGLINILGFGAVSIGSLLVTHVRDRWEFHKTVLSATIICTLGFLGMAMIHKWYGILGIVFIYFSGALIEPLTYGYLHHEAIEKYRATIESAYSLLGRLAVALIGLPFGYLSTQYSIFVGFMYIAIVLGVITCMTIAVRGDSKHWILVISNIILQDS